MNEKLYYSHRMGINEGKLELDINQFKDGFLEVFLGFQRRCYFQEAFGYECTDSGFHPGITGININLYFIRKLQKDFLYPIEENIDSYSEVDLFDIIELLFDLISKPVEGYYHKWNECGWHYHSFNKEVGQEEYRNEINFYLKNYSKGFELSPEGLILIIGDNGLKELLSEPIPEFHPDDIDNRMKHAIIKYRRFNASIEEKRDAVKNLADVLEYFRPKISENILSTKDEDDLFNIANNFDIRHNKGEFYTKHVQQSDYDHQIFLDWIFYWYLATCHLCLNLIKRNGDNIPVHEK